MRKTFILLLSAVILSATLGPRPTLAATFENDTTWWSVDELLEFYPEVEAEKEAECGDNLDCRTEFGFNMIERGPKYAALNNLIETQIWVTSVNPAKETFKVLYFDEEMMLKRMGIEERISLEHLFVGWFEDWSGQIYNYNHEQFLDGSLSGLHIVYDASSGIEGDGWLPAWQEIELSGAGSDLLANTSGKLDYAVFAKDNMFNAQGYFDYSNCLTHPDYVAGMECKMYVSGDQWVKFFPPRETEEPMTSVINEEPSEEMPATNEPEIVESHSAQTRESSPVVPKTPNTGVQTEGREGMIEIPWWLTVLFAINLAAIVWLFMPPRSRRQGKKQKSQKSSKILKKSLDKKPGLR